MEYREYRDRARYGREGSPEGRPGPARGRFGREWDDDPVSGWGGTWADDREYWEPRGQRRQGPGPSRPWGGYGREHDERGFWDRFGDEVRSWFGDEEAARRRMRDEGSDPRGQRGQPWKHRGPSTSPYGPPRYDWETERRGAWGYGAGARFGYDFGPGESWRWREGAEAAERPWWSAETWPHGREQGRGMFRGRGPRGYRRSDERMREDVCDLLTEHADLDASDMQVNVADGEVTLQGSVSTRSDKRLAEDLAASVSGVRQVHNQLRLREGELKQLDYEQPMPERDPRTRAA
jgi:hypothetical protein